MKDQVFKLKKKKKLAIGLMSGTSLDSIDAALVQIKNSGISCRIRQLDFISLPFPPGLKNMLLQNSDLRSGNVTDICRLNFLMAYVYSDAVKKLLEKNELKPDEIDFIGSHGQTIHHLPAKEELFGYKFGSTLQIGDPAVIAKNTTILTVGDFRTGDMALGGQGAPLVPYFDYVLFRSEKCSRALLNIGGISNITYIKKNAGPDDVTAFDTGPGNMMIDLLCRRFYSQEYDEDGRIASSGSINDNLLRHIIELDNFVEKHPPKSTGREYYSEDFINKAIEKIPGLRNKDIVATFTEFTAYAVLRGFELFIKEVPDELFISGGGARNKFLVKRLKYHFGKKTKIKKTESKGISSDGKEAVCFAFLANETLSAAPSNLPNVTGAAKQTILGKICLP